MSNLRFTGAFQPIARGAGVLLLGITASCALPTDASDRIPAQLVLDAPESIELHSLGQSVTIGATVLDQRGMELNSAKLLWEVEDSSILGASEGANLTALSNGETTVRVKVDPSHPGVSRAGYSEGTLTAEIRVVVRQRPATLDLRLPFRKLWAIDQKGQLIAEIVDAEGNPLERDVPLRWTAVNEELANVDEHGMLTALADGVAEIVVEAEGVTATAYVDIAARVPYTACVRSAEITTSRCADASVLVWDR